MIRAVPRAAPLATTSEVPRVGARVRSLRRERGLTIEQVAAATGLTKGFISQLERDMDLALALLDRTDLRRARRQAEPHLRARAGTRTRSARRAAEGRHVLPDEQLPALLPRRAQAAGDRVRGRSRRGLGDELCSLPGEIEFVYVVEGTLEISVADETMTLAAGDSLTYELSKPHTWKNPSKREKLRVLWVAVPNPY